MKKYLLLLPALFFPYIFFLMWEGSPVVLLWQLLFFVVALICDLVFLVKAFSKRWSARGMACAAMLLKLLHIPAFLLVFVGLLLVNVLGVMLWIPMFIFDCMTIALSGIIGIVAAVRCEQEKKLSPVGLVFGSLLSFTFCLDVICAIVVFIKSLSKKSQK